MEATKIAEKTCGACAYWKELDGASGECRVRPPQAIAFRIGDETKVKTCFPVTREQDWCGEFRLR